MSRRKKILEMNRELKSKLRVGELGYFHGLGILGGKISDKEAETAASLLAFRMPVTSEGVMRSIKKFLLQSPDSAVSLERIRLMEEFGDEANRLKLDTHTYSTMGMLIRAASEKTAAELKDLHVHIVNRTGLNRTTYKRYEKGKPEIQHGGSEGDFLVTGPGKEVDVDVSLVVISYAVELTGESHEEAAKRRKKESAKKLSRKRWRNRLGALAVAAAAVSGLYGIYHYCGYPPPQRFLLGSQKAAFDEAWSRCYPHPVAKEHRVKHFGDSLLSDELAEKRASLLCAERDIRQKSR